MALSHLARRHRSDEPDADAGHARSSSPAAQLARACVLLALGRAPLPVPLLLHGHRLAAGRAGHLAGRRLPDPANLTLRRTTRRSTTRINLRPGRCSTPASSPAACSCAPSSSALLAGYALALLHFRGTGHACSRVMLLVQVVPFQLLHDPALRADRARLRPGRHLPRHDPAVRDQLDRGVRLPAVLPAAARGPVRRGPHRRRRRAAHPVVDRACPLVRPAMLTAVLLTFIGPWNEFLWPFLVTKDADHAAARGLAGQLHHQRRRRAQRTRTARSSPARACSPRPPWRCSWSSSSTSPPPNIGSGVKG